jgi:hypothetical protein
VLVLARARPAARALEPVPDGDAEALSPFENSRKSEF